MKLYELSQAYQRILDLVEEGQEVEDTLESLTEAIEVKTENIAKVITSLEAQAEAIKEQEKRLNERRRSIEAQIVSLKQYVQRELRMCGLEKVKGQLFTIGIQKNPPSVEILNESLIPSEFIKTVTTTSVDKKLLLEALKEKDIAGAIIKQSERVTIR